MEFGYQVGRDAAHAAESLPASAAHLRHVRPCLEGEDSREPLLHAQVPELPLGPARPAFLSARHVGLRKRRVKFTAINVARFSMVARSSLFNQQHLQTAQ